MKRVSNVDNWQECSKICFFTQGCKRWTWSHKGYSAAPNSYCLKNETCPGKPLSFVISRDVLTYMRYEKSRNYVW